MLNLAEYRSRADRLADHLPWAALVAPGVVLNKDGSFQRSFAFRGPDLESATEAELVSGARMHSRPVDAAGLHLSLTHRETGAAGTSPVAPR